jgi:hypothetical protein
VKPSDLPPAPEKTANSATFAGSGGLPAAATSDEIHLVADADMSLGEHTEEPDPQLGLPILDVDESSLVLRLVVRDPEVIQALSRIPDPDERGRFALTALRLGVIALGHAHGHIDGDRVRNEGDRILAQLESLLNRSAHSLSTNLATALREYLDPQSGHLQQRLERVLSDDGELARVLNDQVAGQDSALAKTLEQVVGPSSALFKKLDPEHAEGVTNQIETLVTEALEEQRGKVLAQFSLDDEASALSRLVRRITDQQGKLREEFAGDIEEVVRQFSLDDDDSALSRLVKQVERASAGMSEQFSLDHEQSALSRLKRELSSSIDALTRQQREFQEKVIGTLSAMAARKEAADRGVAHGHVFEDDVAELVQREADGAHDVFERVGTTTGLIRHNKKGDMVVTLGPEHAGAGRKIVIEAKEDASYTDQKALDELEEARKNRGADVGVFVLSRRVAGDRAAFRRFGHDVLVVWDPAEPASDVYLHAAMSVARALILKRGANDELEEIDVGAMEKALVNIEKKLGKLDQVAKWTETIRNNAGNILDATAETKRAVLKELDVLRTQTELVADALPEG